MTDTPPSWKRTAKTVAYYFLIFMGFVYLFTYRTSMQNRSGVMGLLIICIVGAILLKRSLDREKKAVEQVVESHGRLEELKHAIIQLAMDHGGVLTVTDVAADLEVSMDEAERGLAALDDGIRVTSTVTEDGVIVYEFKEIIHRQARLRAGNAPDRP